MTDDQLGPFGAPEPSPDDRRKGLEFVLSVLAGGRESGTVCGSDFLALSTTIVERLDALPEPAPGGGSEPVTDTPKDGRLDQLERDRDALDLPDEASNRILARLRESVRDPEPKPQSTMWHCYECDLEHDGGQFCPDSGLTREGVAKPPPLVSRAGGWTTSRAGTSSRQRCCG